MGAKERIQEQIADGQREQLFPEMYDHYNRKVEVLDQTLTFRYVMDAEGYVYQVDRVEIIVKIDGSQEAINLRTGSCAQYASWASISLAIAPPSRAQSGERVAAIVIWGSDDFRGDLLD